MKGAAIQIAYVAVGFVVAGVLLNVLSQIDATRDAAEFVQRGLRG